MIEFLQPVANGLTFGAILALIALGYTMVYGVLKLINFAHGDILMLGAFIALYAAMWADYYGVPPYLVMITPIAICGTLDQGNERGAALGRVILERSFSALETMDCEALLA